MNNTGGHRVQEANEGTVQEGMTAQSTGGHLRSFQKIHCHDVLNKFLSNGVHFSICVKHKKNWLGRERF